MVYLDDSGTYYRMLWLLPVTITIAYGACKAIYKHRRIGLCIVAAAIVLCGGYTYRNDGSATITRAENAYHVPGYVIELCEEMEQVIEGVNVYACVSTELLFYIRQYDSEIHLIYGRDAVEPKWGYYNEFYEAYELAEVVDLEHLLELTRNNGAKVCTYFVLEDGRRLSGNPEDYGLEEVARVDKYILYKDTEAVEIIKEMFKGTVYDK